MRVSLTKERLQQLFENVTTGKDLRDYHISHVMYAAIRKSKFSYMIQNHKPSKEFKEPDLPKYDAMIGDHSGQIQDFEKELVLDDNDALKFNLFLWCSMEMR